MTDDRPHITGIHTADWHLDGGQLDEAKKTIDAIAEHAERMDPPPGFIAITGDVFNTQHERLDSAATKYAFGVVSRLADVAPVLIDLGTPSHDGRCPEVFRHVRARHPVHVTSYPEQIALFDGHWTVLDAVPENYDDLVDAVFTVVPQPTKTWLNDGTIVESDQGVGQAMAAMCAGFGASVEHLQRSGVPHILVGHWQVGGAVVSTGQTLTGVDVEVSADAMRMTNADVALLGHIHKAQVLQEWAYYCGTPYQRNAGETEEKGFYAFDVWAGGHQAEWVRTPYTARHRVEADLTDGIKDLAGLLEVLASEDMAGARLRIDVKAWADESDGLREKIEEAMADKGLAGLDLHIARVPRENVRAKHLMEVDRLREKILGRAEILGEEVPDGVPEMADMLEDLDPDELLAIVAGGGECGVESEAA